MSRRAAAVLLLGATLALTVVGPALAAPPRTGDQLAMVPGGSVTATYPADQPFWIGHGWCAENDSQAKTYRRHATRFELFLDGSSVPLATDLQRDADCGPLSKINFHNFRFGLPAGTYEFVGHWYLDGELFDSGQLEVTFTQ